MLDPCSSVKMMRASPPAGQSINTVTSAMRLLRSVAAASEVGNGAASVELFPICPHEFEPQQKSDEEAVNAQAWLTPAAIETTLAKPGTSFGASENISAPPPPNCLERLSPQQSTLPSTIKAHVKPLPAETATTFWIPGIRTGEIESPVPPAPSWPLSPAPQHATVPPTTTAQVWRSPAEIAVNCSPPPTGTGWLLGEEEKFPSWPRELSPQQNAAEVESSAQAWAPLPAEIAITLNRLVTLTGLLAELFAELPSWPWSPSPQQAAVPSARW